MKKKFFEFNIFRERESMREYTLLSIFSVSNLNEKIENTHNNVSEARCITSSADRTAKGVDKEK
jgi:hypothetical protein